LTRYVFFVSFLLFECKPLPLINIVFKPGGFPAKHQCVIGLHSNNNIHTTERTINVRDETGKFKKKMGKSYGVRTIDYGLCV